MDDDDLAMFIKRSQSAPPIRDIQDRSMPSSPIGESSQRELDILLSEEYHSYYREHRNLEPRLPMPVKAPVRPTPLNPHLQELNIREPKAMHPGDASGFMDGSLLGTDITTAVGGVTAIPASDDATNMNPLLSRKSCVAMIQEDFPRTSSPIYQECETQQPPASPIVRKGSPKPTIAGDLDHLPIVVPTPPGAAHKLTGLESLPLAVGPTSEFSLPEGPQDCAQGTSLPAAAQPVVSHPGTSASPPPGYSAADIRLDLQSLDDQAARGGAPQQHQVVQPPVPGPGAYASTMHSDGLPMGGQQDQYGGYPPHMGYMPHGYPAYPPYYPHPHPMYPPYVSRGGYPPHQNPHAPPPYAPPPPNGPPGPNHASSHHRMQGGHLPISPHMGPQQPPHGQYPPDVAQLMGYPPDASMHEMDAPPVRQVQPVGDSTGSAAAGKGPQPNNHALFPPLESNSPRTVPRSPPHQAAPGQLSLTPSLMPASETQAHTTHTDPALTQDLTLAMGQLTTGDPMRLGPPPPPSGHGHAPTHMDMDTHMHTHMHMHAHGGAPSGPPPRPRRGSNSAGAAILASVQGGVGGSMGGMTMGMGLGGAPHGGTGPHQQGPPPSGGQGQQPGGKGRNAGSARRGARHAPGFSNTPPALPPASLPHSKQQLSSQTQPGPMRPHAPPPHHAHAHGHSHAHGHAHGHGAPASMGGMGGAAGNVMLPGMLNEDVLLHAFHCDKATKLEVRELLGHVLRFSTDQQGSRYIQRVLETASHEEKALMFQEIYPHAKHLMTDAFGNYVIQKFFEFGTPEQKALLAQELKGSVLALTLQMYGCRVIQKALETIPQSLRIELVSELEAHVLRCIKDQNGNHVIQKCIEQVPAANIQFILDAFETSGGVFQLAVHPYGCRVIQRVLEHCLIKQTHPILEELLSHAVQLVQNQYGNYVIQHIIQNGKVSERTRIFNQIRGQFPSLSRHKYASNVVEKCLQYGTPQQRQAIFDELLIDHNCVLAMIRDQFGNYVIQKMFEVANETQRDALLREIRPIQNQIKKFTYGKHIYARIERFLHGMGHH